MRMDDNEYRIVEDDEYTIVDNDEPRREIPRAYTILIKKSILDAAKYNELMKKYHSGRR